MAQNRRFIPLFLAVAFAGLILAGCGSNTEVVKTETGTGQGGTTSLLWSPSDLQNQMDTNPDLVILDCRARFTTDPDGSYYVPWDREHIAGSYFMDFFVFGDPYPTDLNGIIQRLSELGITLNSPICLYDSGIANPQGKIFYNLERLGCLDVHILDGGFPVWKNAGGAVSTEPTPLPAPSSFVPIIDDSIYAELPEMKDIFDMVQAGSNFFTITDYREPPLYWGHKICPDAAGFDLCLGQEETCGAVVVFMPVQEL